MGYVKKCLVILLTTCFENLDDQFEMEVRFQH